MIPKVRSKTNNVGTNKSKQIFKSMSLDVLDRCKTDLVAQKSQGFWEQVKKTASYSTELLTRNNNFSKRG